MGEPKLGGAAGFLTAGGFAAAFWGAGALCDAAQTTNTPTTSNSTESDFICDCIIANSFLFEVT